MKKSLIIWIVGVILVVGVALALAHRGSNIRQENINGQQSQNTQQSTNSTNQATNIKSISIENMAFSPETVTIKKGTTVTWTNQDSAEHTVTADSGDGPKSDLLAQGEAYTFKYDTAGTFKYHCSVHSNMTATVVVTE